MGASGAGGASGGQSERTGRLIKHSKKSKPIRQGSTTNDESALSSASAVPLSFGLLAAGEHALRQLNQLEQAIDCLVAKDEGRAAQTVSAGLNSVHSRMREGVLELESAPAVPLRH